MARLLRPISARVRILAAVLAVACVGLAIVGSVTFLVQRERLLAGIDDRLESQVGQLDAMAVAPSEPVDRNGGDATTAAEDPDAAEYATVEEYLHAAVGRLVPGGNEASVAIVDGDARFRPSTPSGFDVSGDDTFLARVTTEAEAAGEPVMGTAVTREGTLRYIAIPVTMAGDPSTGVYVRAVALDAEVEPLTAAMLTYAIAAVVVLAAIGIVGWFVAGRLLSPLRRMRETASAITLTDLSPRLPEQGNDDIADLSRTVNSMLDRLEGSVDSQRQLLDDVRHELKTPLTIVRGHLELMDASDAADVTTAREIGIAELDRLTRLIEDIDALATVEAAPPALGEIDVGALAERFGELVAVIPDHVWSVATCGRGRIVGDQDRLLQAWLQLADNAAKYTPRQSAIEIGSAVDGSGARLWVRDHGAGIADAHRSRIFNRFDRGGGKRTVGGSGLGLAIVDAIAKSHGGRCAVTDTPGGGVTFTIHLPLPAQDLPAPVRAGDVVLQRKAAG